MKKYTKKVLLQSTDLCFMQIHLQQKNFSHFYIIHILLVCCLVYSVAEKGKMLQKSKNRYKKKGLLPRK